MDIQVREYDHVNERRILNYVVKRTALFAGVDFQQNDDIVASFDFEGFIDGALAMTIEIKKRSIASTQFDTYFISTEKYKEVQSNPDIPHYIFYGFTVDRVIRVYNLNEIELVPHQLQFTHKRTGQNMSQLVYLVPSNDYIEEFKLEPK